ncbi:carbon-nitrogen hydrolase family protein [Algihabitans albus]|uniref:carbon-nitrogen hydrolase family protein n=1 Tax=Algihabitans albus TaxID=2164067 RepID=UPI0035CFADF2
MKIALFQTAGAGSVSANLDLLETRAAEAAAQGARLLIAPEMFLTGYNIGERTWELAERADGPAAQRAAGIAARHGLALLYGFPEYHGEEVYNAALFVDRDGRRELYRKAHLFGSQEQRLFVRGPHRPPLVELDGLKIGLLICYDVEFPEAVRALAVAGADVIAVPTALMAPYSIVADTLVPTRAYENGVFVAYVNRVGTEGDLAYVGRSCLIGPDGVALLRAEADGEALLIAEIDPADIARLRRVNPYFADLRDDLYS